MSTKLQPDLPAVTRCPDLAHGKACFGGTRLPIKSLFDYLVESDSIDNFLSSFSFVTKEEVIGVLDFAEESAKTLAPEMSYDEIITKKNAANDVAQDPVAMKHGG